jgi:S1-C subfamily serine protease
MRCSLLTIAIVLLAASFSQAQDAAAPAASDSWEHAAQALQAATVTVRISTNRSDAQPAAAADGDAVTVCSGVMVREKHIVTAAMAGSDSTIRLTIAGGKQAVARLQVIDEFSGLALLECDAAVGTPLAFATAAPAVGAGVMTASAWGAQAPLVSQGIVAGIERQRQGGSYPPLLQCDLRTTDTSSGAGVVDRRGQLVGIIVAADSPESRRGWAYAVPVSHVERLLRTADGQQQAGVTIIKRRRPVAGLTLDQDGESIVVSRVFAGGAAERAGMKVGDIILATDGVAIRSVYQAMLPTLYKQPGDTLIFKVRRETGASDVQLVLGGGVEVASAPIELLSGLIQPKVQVVREGSGYIARRPGDTIREVFQPELPPESPLDETPKTATPAEKIALLEKALDRYRAVIELQQRELEMLRRQLEAAPPK